MRQFKRTLCMILCAVTVFGLLQVMPLKAEAVTMTSSPEMIDVLKQMEGFNKYPFWDYAQWTVGYGTLCPSDMLSYYKANGITEEAALALLRQELDSFEADVNNFMNKKKLTLDQGQFDALVSFSYNVGSAWMSKSNTNIYRAVMAGGKGADIIYAMTLYSMAGGDYLGGLIKRRLSEANMYINGIYRASNATDGIPANYKWVFLNGNGATLDSNIYGYDSQLGTKLSVIFKNVPTGVDANGKAFAYTLEGWYTETGTKVTVLDDTLSNGQKLKAHWVDPQGKDLEDAVQTPVNTTVTVTSNNVNIRKGPGTGYDLNGTANTGDQFIITAVATGNGLRWGKITDERWICLSYTDYVADPGVDPNPGTTTTTSKSGAVNANSVLVHQDPGTEHAAIGTLNKGDRVVVTEEDRSGAMPWGKIGENQWVCLDYVTYDSSKITRVELIRMPDQTSYETVDDMVRLDGSIIQVTAADGSIQALSLTNDKVTDFSMTGTKKGTITVVYEGYKFFIPVAITGARLAIKKQPVDHYAEIGETVTFELNAVGEGVTYKWYVQKAMEAFFEPMDETAASLTFEMTDELANARFYCELTDTNGVVLESRIVTAYKGAREDYINISEQPQNQYVASGETAIVAVVAEGEGLTYQWYYKDVGKSSFEKSSTTTATYLSVINSDRDGRQVYCVITDAAGRTITTETATLNIKRDLVITSQPLNAAAPVGEIATTSILATGNDLFYVWYVMDPSSSDYTAADVTGNQFGMEMTQALNGTKVYCEVFDCHGASLTPRS